MDSMIRSAPLGLYNLVAHYDRNEINNPIMIECDNCHGWGKEFYSNCCGEQVIDKKCSHCGDDCFECHEKCEQCNGEGEVEL
jgi:DnaJ-class molecular chaperone